MRDYMRQRRAPDTPTPAPVGELRRRESRCVSNLSVDLLPAVNSRAVRLLENDRLMMQLVALERTTRGGGKDKVDHPRGAHDDLANAAAGALVLCRDEVTYSPAQRARDNQKIAAAYKKWARSYA